MAGVDDIQVAAGNAAVASASARSELVPPKALTASTVRSAGLLNTCDTEGFLQLAFHLGVLALCASTVSWCHSRGYWLLLLLAEVPYGVAVSFLFNAFHECIHNTAFASPWVNTLFAQLLGFVTFRGAMWMWCFHWAHHRFTNDPAKDPELSGGSLDLDDPTRSMGGYFAFLSGYPFGFERVPNMFRRACGNCEDPWVVDKPEKTKRKVRIEAGCYCLGYSLLGLLALVRPLSAGMPLVLYWLLPHVFGAGHLRMYQFAEHRSCLMGSHTDTNAWMCSRTTATWWLYRKLAWQMPWHVEHHAYPNVPFHHLAELHQMTVEAYSKEGKEVPSGCTPHGRRGYLGIHAEFFSQMLNNVSSSKSSKAAKAA